MMTDNTVTFQHPLPAAVQPLRQRPAGDPASRRQGEPFATATINVPTMPLAEDQVLIRTTAKTKACSRRFEEAGVVRTTGVRCRLGYVQADVCHLLIPAPALH